MSVSRAPTPEALAAIKAGKIMADRRAGRAKEAPITCGTCSLSAEKAKALRGEAFECSHVDCPNRRRLTAAPPDAPPLGWFHAGADD